ncbi:MAG: NUDIX hydrolase [Gemmatimonadaceae bacterium]
MTKGPDPDVGPWRIGTSSDLSGQVGSRRLYTGRVISLDVDSVRFPNGTTGDLEMIRHSGASAVLPFLNDPDRDDAEVLLIRQYRYATGGYILEIPAGRLDPGELPLACASRELKEETGYTAEHLDPLMTIFTTPGFTDERIHLFMARGLARGDANLETDEILDPVSMRFHQALQMVESGEICDGKTVIALLFAATFRQRR